MDTKEKDLKVVTLYIEGNSCANIAKKLKIGNTTVYDVLKRNETPLRIQERKKVNCDICDKPIPEDVITRNRCNTCRTNIRRYVAKSNAVEYKGGECQMCGWIGNIAAFDFHHKYDKKFGLSANIATKSWKIVKEELDKCDLLCAICHRIKHTEYKNEKLLEAVKNYIGKVFV